MQKEHKDKMLTLVNTSGFPFQIAVSNHIEKTKNIHGWSVFSEENPWENSDTNRGGYIDLVLINQHNTEMIIVECKRVRDAKWIFLPTSNNFRRRQAKCWISSLDMGRKNIGWYDVTLDPDSPQANYCVIRAHDKNSNPILERIASELVEATESIALEELKLIKLNKEDRIRKFYWPVIITTAKLYVCVFNPDNDLKIENGEISDAEFREVPLVRFRKSLTTRLSNDVIPPNLAHAVREKERTVFVINASNIIEILKEWEISSGPWSNQQW